MQYPKFNVVMMENIHQALKWGLWNAPIWHLQTFGLGFHSVRIITQFNMVDRYTKLSFLIFRYAIYDSSSMQLYIYHDKMEVLCYVQVTYSNLFQKKRNENTKAILIIELSELSLINESTIYCFTDKSFLSRTRSCIHNKYTIAVCYVNRHTRLS